MPVLAEAECVPSQSFERQIAAERPYLRNVAMRICGNGAEVDDLIQEAMVRALSNRLRFRAGTNLRAWLNCLMRNHFINNCRRRSRETLTDFRAPDVFSGSAPATQEWGLRVQEVQKAIASLPDFQRTALLEVSAGDDYHSVAKLLGCEVGTVKSRVSRARQALLASLGETHPTAASAL